MANDFNASVVISTKESEAGIRQLDSAARDLDKTLQNLHKSLQAGQGDLDRVTKSMTTLTRANAELIRSEQARAKATVIAAKADGVAIDNQAKRSKIARENEIKDAKVAKLRQQTVTGGQSGAATVMRRDAESAARVAATQAVTQARVNSEATRGAVAQQNLATATIRTSTAAAQAAATQQRLAGSSRSAQSGTLALNDSLSNSRYLLYDVGQTYAVLAAALQVIPVATAAVAIAYEKDFAQVMRTNDSLKDSTGGFANLRQELKELATEIPLTFGEFSNIATIGGQLGISGDSIDSFTESVARFGAASNVSLDQASTAFGRFQNSFDPNRTDPDFFNKIGSAIAYVGVKSAATETEIIAVSNQISAAGAQFGFAADEIVGLSGALASVRIRPELARGAFQRIMLGLSRAADEGGEAFDKFGKYTGLAAEEAQALFKNDPSAFFYKYIGGIKGAIKETGSVSAVLDDIGAKNVFDKQFILGLANGYKVFGDSLGYADESFAKGSFLKESTAGIFETVDAKIKRINSSIKNLADTVGKGSLGGLSHIADQLLGITNAADRFIQATPAFAGFLNIMLGLGSAIGILLAFKAAQAFVLAGLVGFQQVLGKGTLAAGLTAKGILQQVAVTSLMAKGATQAHAQALVLQTGAFKAMTVAARSANGALATSGAVAATAGARGLTGALGGVAKGMLGIVGGPLGALVLGLGAIALGFITAEEKATSAGEAIARAMKNGANAGMQAIGDALTDRTVDSFITDVGSGGLENHGKNMRQLAADVGISFDSIVASIAKGKDASAEFKKVLDSYAQSKGFASYADLQAKSMTNLANKKGELQLLDRVVKELGDKQAKAAEDIKATDSAVTKLGDGAANAAPSVEGIGEAIAGAGEEGETAADKLDKFIDSIFGMVDASAATSSALQELGESLANSSDFGPGTEGGRENVNAFRETLKAAAQEQQWLIDNTGKTTQQAAADYIAFVEGLVSEMTARGVDPAYVQGLADQAKGYFGSAIAAGPVPTIPVKVDGEQAMASAVSTMDAVRQVVGTNPFNFHIGANTDDARNNLQNLAQGVAEITGYPYQMVVDALTNPAHEKSQEIYALIKSITDRTYTAPIGADTSAAVTNVRNFANYASQQLAAVQSAYNSVAASAPTFAKYTKPLFKGVTGVAAPKGIARPATSNASVAKVAEPVQVKPTAQPNFGALNDGYNKVRDAANKAGDAGKKAGEDMANGMDDATQAAEDYANRLKQGFTSAFNKQYGVQKATDDYYSALNEINKKRDDELKQIDDLISKQKELNDEVAEQMVDARKAGIEKDISLKYGEVDRAADYAQQEQEALNAAEAKRKDIAANNAQIISLRAGIGELNGYSEAAISNREALRNLESKMLDMVVAYAATGASVDQVRAYAQRLTAQFQIDAGQVWQNRVQVDGLTGNMQRYIDTVNRVPYHKPTTVTADVGGPGHGATGAINGFNGAADWATRPRTVQVDVNLQRFEQKWWEATLRVGRYLDGINNMPAMGPMGRSGGIPVNMNYAKGGSVKGFASGGLIPGKAPSDLSKDNMFASVDGKGLVKVQSEEFIMQKRAVDFWGTDVMNAMNSMKMPAFSGGGSLGSSKSAAGGSGPLLVELTAENLQAILRLAERDINLFAGVEQIASSANEGNRILATKGVS